MNRYRAFGVTAALAIAVVASPLASQAALPSGFDVELMEGFVEVQPDGARWARFRYVMPALAEGAAFDKVQQDFAVLCNGAAVPMLDAAGEEVSQVVVSLMDKPLEFGQSDPGTVQYFEVFTLREGRCIWEEF